MYARYLKDIRSTPFWDPSLGKKSGEGKHKGFGKTVKAVV